MSLPWFKFQPAAWRGDQALRAVSLTARGLWIECLCIMHEAKPYGHLVLNGKPIDAATLARMTGVPVDDVRALLAELRQAGVLSVASTGVILSRRMVKDHERANLGRRSANRRWAQVPEPTAQSGEPNGSGNGLPNAETQDSRFPPKTPAATPRPPAATLRPPGDTLSSGPGDTLSSGPGDTPSAPARPRASRRGKGASALLEQARRMQAEAAP
jgi:predicted transcriptional regulator